jgi:AcrR family transcriptional regulator
MPDPRIERTRTHVLTIARAMLAERSGEPLTFSRLAEAAQVSRRTLYTHWGSVERVIGDAAEFQPAATTNDLQGMSKRELLTHLIESVRDRLADPASHVAVTSLVAQASMDSRAAETLETVATARLEDFNEFLAPTTREQYGQIMGPLFFQAVVLNEEVTAERIDEFVDAGVEILGLSDN